MTRHLDRRSVMAWLAAFLVMAFAGCTSFAPTTAPSVTPTIGPGPSPAGTGLQLTEAEARLFLIAQLGPLWFCDPDSYPVARDEQAAAIERYPEMVGDEEMFEAVAKQLGIDAGAKHTDRAKLELYRVWKVARAVPLEPIGPGQWRFDYLVQPAPGETTGTRSAGIVDAQGAITVEQQAPAGEPMCPICLAVGTVIETPNGATPVDRLRLGAPVWTLDAAGRRIVGSVTALGSTAAPTDHHVTRITLADGRSVTASPGHPLADGRTLADLAIGDAIDGSTVTGLETIRYDAPETFDLAVSGPTGVYVAGGIPLGSTLD